MLDRVCPIFGGIGDSPVAILSAPRPPTSIAQTCIRASAETYLSIARRACGRVPVWLEVGVVVVVVEVVILSCIHVFDSFIRFGLRPLPVAGRFRRRHR